MQLEERKALIGFIAEIEASRDRAKGETRYQSEVFKKAKEKGFDNKAMRKVLQRRAMSESDRQREDGLVDEYEHALGALANARDAVAAGMSAREAAERYNVPRGALAVVSRGPENENSEPPRKIDVITPPEVAALPAHDPSTGEIIDTKEADTQGDAPNSRSDPSLPAEQSVNPRPSPDRVSVGVTRGKEGDPAPVSESGVVTVPPDDGGSGTACGPSPAPAAVIQSGDQPAEGESSTQSCGGRGVAERHENPTPHGLAPEEKGPSTPSHASTLPIEAGQGRETAGNVAISEQPLDRMPLAAPPQDPATAPPACSGDIDWDRDVGPIPARLRGSSKMVPA